MQSFKLRTHVGEDGILHLDVPVGVHDAEIEVTVTFKAIIPPKAKTPEELGYPPGFFERTFGSLRDEPLEREEQGELQEREPLE